MAKLKAERSFRVKYKARAEAEGTVIYKLPDEDVPKFRGKANLEQMALEISPDIESLAEGYQSVAMGEHGICPEGVQPDWESQPEDWTYFPDVEIESIEDITNEVAVVEHTEKLVKTYKCVVPYGKHKPEVGVLYNCRVNGISVSIDVEPMDAAFTMELSRGDLGVTKQDADDVLRTLARGGLEDGHMNLTSSAGCPPMTKTMEKSILKLFA
tara:strand:- start:1080 stop:1715 length:636 start_codon:yes stop_codon:yes gene_type:complete